MYFLDLLQDVTRAWMRRGFDPFIQCLHPTLKSLLLEYCITWRKDHLNNGMQLIFYLICIKTAINNRVLNQSLQDYAIRDNRPDFAWLKVA